MTEGLGKIAAIQLMINSITQQCMAYEECKKLTNCTNRTMEDLVKYKKYLENKLAELKTP